VKWAVVGLAVALVGSNAFWLYVHLDQAVSAAYREQTCAEYDEALSQALAVIRLAKGRAVRREVVQAARAALLDSEEPFDSEGETVVGRLSFEFASDGAFIDVRQNGLGPGLCSARIKPRGGRNR
jgi:hypothetical protein